MKALVTGASSGIGKDISKYLDELGYEIILVARDEIKLKSIASTLKNKSRIIVLDLSVESNCVKLHDSLKEDKIDVLVNNAGFGMFGDFTETGLKKELEMIDLNIKAVHILTKLFLKDMKKTDHGYILNVASLASFQAGPLMATYYATKAYVVRLTMAIYEELRISKSKVVVSALCPGPVATNFNKVANVSFSVKALDSTYVAKYAINKMFKKKLIIIPGFMMRLSYYLSKIIPKKTLLKITYNIQKRKV